MKTLLRMTLVVGVAFLASLTMAQEIDPAVIEQRVKDVAERLELSDGQIEQVSPVIKSAMEQQQRILESYGVDPANRGEGGKRLGLRDARAMSSEMSAVRDDTRDALDGILTDEQRDEFLVMQEERRAELRERIRTGK
jgi:hypothetical protein